MSVTDISRYEMKYVIPGGLVSALREWLAPYCVGDRNCAGEWYTINSLYLDTRQWRLFRDTTENAPYRFKLRLRSYGEDTGSSPVKIEVKRRLRDLVVKRTAVLSAEKWNDSNPAGNRTAVADTGLAASWFHDLAQRTHAVPRLLVRYERLALSSDIDNYVRVTFDRRVRCQRMDDWRLRNPGSDWLYVDNPSTFGHNESGYVMEIKFSGAAPPWLIDMTRRFGLQRRGFSKYARSVRRLFSDREPAWDLRTSTVSAAGDVLWS